MITYATLKHGDTLQLTKPAGNLFKQGDLVTVRFVSRGQSVVVEDRFGRQAEFYDACGAAYLELVTT